jgi:uncharacterized membrane-anchored protein
MRSRLFAAAAALSLFTLCQGQSLPDTGDGEIPVEDLQLMLTAYMDSINASYTFTTGSIPLADGVATVNITEEFKYLDAEQSRRLIVDLWGNPPEVAADVLGIIFPADAGVVDYPFAFVIEYDPMGYVSDSDADEIDYSELLSSMMKDDVQENEQRRAAGYSGLELLGWASPPYYDKDRKVLHWAKEFRADDADGNTLNYNVRILGRKGVLIMNAVADMEDLGAVQENIPAVLSMASFNEGFAYADFDSSVDEVAAWTIGGLVAGKVLAKAGILALLLKNIKLVIIALAAAGGAIWKLITGRKQKEDTQQA